MADLSQGLGPVYSAVDASPEGGCAKRLRPFFPFRRGARLARQDSPKNDAMDFTHASGPKIGPDGLQCLEMAQIQQGLGGAQPGKSGIPFQHLTQGLQGASPQ
jgi:hypothetical protein